MSDDEPGFRTAADLRAEASGGVSPDFTIPEHPTRRYPRAGGVEYEGGTVFRVTPDGEWSETDLAAVVERVLSDDVYRYGDWFDLPMPLYLVHDDATCDTFRVAVRDGRVEFHVRPNTTSAGLRALYERLTETTNVSWRVERSG